MKTEGEARGFQHFPRDLANVNEWKIMFDPSISTWKNKIVKVLTIWYQNDMRFVILGLSGPVNNEVISSYVSRFEAGLISKSSL